MTRGTLGPVLTVVTVMLVVWYAACAPMNIREVLSQAERDGAAIVPPSAVERAETSRFVLLFTNLEHAGPSWSQDRSRLPAPHQVVAEIWETTAVEEATGRRGLWNSCWEDGDATDTEAEPEQVFVWQSCAFSTRGLIHHAGLTLWATVLGFALGAGIGIGLAVAVVHSRTMEMSALPLSIVSQTVPIIAIAPMVITVLYAVGVEGTVPKALISAYLSFFPVMVGMIKGLRAPDAMQLDLLRTYGAAPGPVLRKLRLPASVPYLFASLKIGVAASLVGAIVGELSVQRGGLGARMLAGTYTGQTAQIWAALFATALLAGLLVQAVTLAERRAARLMGAPA